MTDTRQESLRLQIKERAADFFRDVFDAQGAMVTVTNCMLADGGKKAIVFVSVLPEESGSDIMKHLAPAQKKLREYIGEHARLKYLPFITCSLDEGEQNRRRIDELLGES